uniref:Uncharacterized protein n=1 Tax=Arundo donax TaxID=35708 RepID=A0A0A9GMV2_ARUDO
MPYFHSRRSWGLFKKRSRLLCRKCGGRIGNAYEEEEYRDSNLCDGDGCSDDMRATSGSGGSCSSASSQKNYVIKISALQPSLDDSAVVPFTP